MPMHYLRAMTSPQRTDISNRRLGRSLAFVAGAVNAGGFFAVGQYTSHMTGVVSSVADNAALGEVHLVLAGVESLLSFLLGAATSAILINWGRRRGAHSLYALPLIVEAALLLCFGLMGARLDASGQVSAIVALLCFVMGLQNAIVTKVSRSEIRTTHVTGLVTDIGIELGKLFYWNDNALGERVLADRGKLRLLSSLLAMFLLGGLAGAFGFKYLGYIVTVPLAVGLLSLAIIPVFDDLLQAKS
ncbi:DUF1275 domain-containing protein [Rugamonas sp. FT107W]|uniref:DUF1275 domain-containing protein n=1 Tax=Duganella vulcania TaxID=2692166 RepID=A0A845HHN9_9BURK|nr:YoaK family protein [Duganella vulcania]MYN17887.1 DUF1275 domain-containing protein [Duganella vulcania]